MGNPQYRQQWFETWLDNHRDIAPDVKIEFVQTKGTADIREKITMTALSGATDDLPDAAMLDPVTIQDLAKAGLLKDETEYLTPLIDKMVDGAATDATISGHIYALPDSVRPQVLFYNKAIFDEYGIDPENDEDYGRLYRSWTSVKGKEQRRSLLILYRSYQQDLEILGTSWFNAICRC